MRPRLRLTPFWPALATRVATGALLWLVLPVLIHKGLGGPGGPGGALRLDAFEALFAALALALGGAGAGVLVFAWWIDRRLVRPLARLTAGAGELARAR